MKTKLILLALILLPSSSLLLAGPIEDIQAIQAKSRNPVVLLIDPQQKYEKPGDVEKIKNIAELIEYAGINNIRTIVIAMGSHAHLSMKLIWRLQNTNIISITKRISVLS